MSSSYGKNLLHHLSEYLFFLSTSTLFWSGLDSSYDHEFHLSTWFGMMPQDMRMTDSNETINNEKEGGEGSVLVEATITTIMWQHWWQHYCNVDWDS